MKFRKLIAVFVALFCVLTATACEARLEADKEQVIKQSETQAITTAKTQNSFVNFTEFSDFLNTVMADNCFSPLDNEAQSRKFYFLMQHMLEVGKTMNLTAIKEEKAIIVRHFLDRLTVEPILPKNAKIPVKSKKRASPSANRGCRLCGLLI